MLALHAKRGVETTLERVFLASGKKFNVLNVLWNCETAAVKFEKQGEFYSAYFLMPAVDDVAVVPSATFNHWVGFAMHELGHVWYTDNEAWDDAVKSNGDNEVLHRIINGLEDPRIELEVIRSGFANNSKTLFEHLINSITDEGGEVKPDDFKNIAFMLAIEGRRLNGYAINHSEILPKCPWADLLAPALAEAHKATSTKQIVDIAVRLWKDLSKEQEKEQESKQESEQGEQQGKSQEESGAGDIREVEPNGFIEKSCIKVGLQEKAMPAVVQPRVIEFDFQ